MKAPGGEDAITNKVQEKGDAQTLLDLRHLTLRGEKASAIMFVRDAIESAFHQVYREVRCAKVSPPALVQTQVEGGSTLFKFDYYGEPAYLTQSFRNYTWKHACPQWVMCTALKNLSVRRNL